jgi:hypothetical protein
MSAVSAVGIAGILKGAVTVDRALLLNAIVMGVCLAVVLLVADTNWPQHMGEEQGILWSHVIARVGL